jgi:hypothetical protein
VGFVRAIVDDGGEEKRRTKEGRTWRAGGDGVVVCIFL